ncbi:MAG: hypothetical protein G3M70_02630 [Candidatus Nitronauta litoralis]|uniref:DDH domain-containing protein n=1 Tax=Candidatus Nitronauta litoralis TaxID=2705533 RepID=A0A7T0FZI4_9BACT|nr:MAG: hypothetical protein G3M70_02630 [Candidatus Nitronauta litoralis]
MISKLAVSSEAWGPALSQSASFLRGHSGFVFCGYPDADALGSMLSLALYLKELGKRVYIVWPGPLIGKTDFLEDILRHNRVPLLGTAERIREYSEKVDALVVCDTANRKLVPLYKELKQHILAKETPVLEIDHHFGTDSEPVHPDGLHLFREANSTTEIAAEVLEAYAKADSEAPDPFKRRNILVSLLTGLIADTGGGNVSIRPEDYDFWVKRLGDRLTEKTRRGRVDTDQDVPHFSSPEDIKEFLVKLSDSERQGVERLQEEIVHENGVGVLNLLDATRSRVEASLQLSAAAWAQILETMANAIPEVAGRVGMVYFHDKTAEGEDCYFIKLRRAQESAIDLRETESDIRSAFEDGAVLGGGGHPNAVSYRVRLIPEDQFLKSVEKLTKTLRESF